MNDLELMTLRLQVDYTLDERGRLLTTNEPSEDERKVAPAVVVGATSLGNIVRIRADVPDPIADQIARIPEHLDLNQLSIAIRHALDPIGASVIEGGPAYRFPEPSLDKRDTVEITAENLALVDQHFDWLRDEYENWGSCFVSVRDGHGVAVCFSSRRNDLAAEAGVVTVPHLRGQGLAPRVTASWVKAVLASGKIPFYGTSFDNAASQRVAAKLGLQKIGEELSFGLQPR